MNGFGFSTKRILVSIILALIFILWFLLMLCTSPVQGGYAYGATYQSLSDFPDEVELEAFLEADNADQHVYLVADKNGVVKFNDNAYASRASCVKRALLLRDNAAKLGWRLETEVLTGSEYRYFYGKQLGVGQFSIHMVCTARIGNDWWYIEPSDDRRWVGFTLD